MRFQIRTRRLVSAASVILPRQRAWILLVQPAPLLVLASRSSKLAPMFQIRSLQNVRLARGQTQLIQLQERNYLRVQTSAQLQFAVLANAFSIARIQAMLHASIALRTPIHILAQTLTHAMIAHLRPHCVRLATTSKTALQHQTPFVTYAQRVPTQSAERKNTSARLAGQIRRAMLDRGYRHVARKQKPRALLAGPKHGVLEDQPQSVRSAQHQFATQASTSDPAPPHLMQHALSALREPTPLMALLLIVALQPQNALKAVRM
jgi:hypothetical protein